MASIGAAVYSSPVDFRFPQAPPDNLDPKIRNALVEVYGGINNLIQALINNCGIGQQPLQFWPLLALNPASSILSGNLGRCYVIATENIVQGAAVSLFLSGGILAARNANATDNTKPCRAFCSTIGGILLGAVGEVQLGTGVAIINGLVIGSNYWLSTLNGLVANAPAIAAGNIEQYIGFALDGTHLFYNLGYWIQH